MSGNQLCASTTAQQLDVEQILIDAQSRWLRPAEICEILRNFQNFCIAPEPPNRPPSGSIFLFDRKILRYFRKDGYNWRKKKDGKTVKEAHERLKAGSIDVLHCYYAHGEENDKFQRRSYWMLEEKYMHIVLVHYREVKGNKTSHTKGVVPHSVYDHSPVASNSLTIRNQITSQTTDANYPDSVQISGYEDSKMDNFQASSRHYPIPEMSQFANLMDASLPKTCFPVFQNTQGDSEERGTTVFDETKYEITHNETKSQMGLTSLDEVLEYCNVEHQTHFPSTFHNNLESIPTRRKSVVSNHEVSTGKLSSGIKDVANTYGQENLQFPGPDSFVMVSKKDADNEINDDHCSILNQPSTINDVQGDKSLKKYDSFSRWMSKELGQMDNSNMQSSSETYWDVADSEGVVEDFSSSRQDDLYPYPYVLSPSLSQDQYFSIIDFSPNWAYSDMETKVIITGTFIMSKIEVERCKWSCMFGEVEVPADALSDGILRCYAPPHKVGRVPFYVTCSNRLACSEVREFEYLVSHAQYMENSETYAGSKNEMLLHIRLEELLSLGLGTYESLELKMCHANYEKSLIRNQISSLLLKSDERYALAKKTNEIKFSSRTSKDELMQKLLKEKLHAWLLCKVVEDGKGPNILDKEGQGVIHLAAGLGYDWAIKPIVLAGVNINFRDARGWSALHWAAYFGRERTVAMLISLDTAPGALTDPTPEFPNGRTPADLASSNGHKGIAGYLAESSLTTHLSVLTLRDSLQTESIDIEDTTERHANKFDERTVQTGSSLEDSLSAVRSATLAAASIQQVFRVQSFHRKKLVESSDTKCRMVGEHALSLVAIKTNKTRHSNEPVHAAAIRIQNSFRGWKGKKEFTVIRQHIVKIQAHVRGHQVRKHFRKVVWSVGIVEKVILRWRRKGSGLRGFRSNALTKISDIQIPSKDDGGDEDYDFLREGRKQTEQRMNRALSRVKSMVQYPEARDQYRRLLTGVEELKVSKDDAPGGTLEKETDDLMMFDVTELLGEEDVHMSPA